SAVSSAVSSSVFFFQAEVCIRAFHVTAVQTCALPILAAVVPHARLMFNIVFFCTLVSLVVQGTSLSRAAVWLGLAEKPSELKKLEEFDMEFSDEIKSVTTEITITPLSLRGGNHLMDLPLPDKTLAVLVKREGKYFVPKGKTVLQENDKVLIITDDQ